MNPDSLNAHESGIRTGARTRRLRRAALVLAACLLPVAIGGCAAVRPFEREYLSLRIMNFDTEATEQALERHWLETLEGSSGGSGGSGGGCACN